MRQIFTTRLVQPTNPLLGTTDYWVPTGTFDSTASAASGRTLWPTDGAFTSLIVTLDAAPGSGKSWLLTLRVNDVDTALAVTISDSATTARITGSAAISAGQVVSMSCVPSGTPTTPGSGGIRVSLEFDSTNTGESGYAGQPSVIFGNNVTLVNGLFSSWGWAATANLAERINVVAADGNVTALYAYQSVASGTGITLTYAIVKNGTLQDGSGGSVDTRVVITGAVQTTDSATFTLPVVAGDEVYVQVVGTGGLAIVGAAGTSCRFVATTDGQSQMCGNPGTTANMAATEYWTPVSVDTTNNTSESAAIVYGSLTPFTLSGMRVIVSVAPSLGDSVAWDVRQNGSSPVGGPTTTISGTATDGTGTGTVTISDGDEWCVRSVPSGTPATSTAAWAFIQAEVAIPSQRNLLVGANHTLTSATDSAIVGVGNSVEGATSQAHGQDVDVVGDVSIGINLTDTPRTVTGDKKYHLWADEILHNGIAPGSVADDAVTNAKLANMAQATIKGRASGAGTGDPVDLTADQASTILDTASDPFVRTSDLGAGAGALDDLSDVIITAPTLGQVLKYDGSDWINDTDATGGGGGVDTTTAAQASRPAASNDGNLFFPSDGFSIQRDTGAAWQLWGPSFPWTAPVDGDFAWVNQGGASVVTTNGGIFLRAPASSTGQRLRVKSAPSTPYVITTAVSVPQIGTVAAGGIGFRQSSDGKLIVLAAYNIYLDVFKMTNPTTFSAFYLQSNLNNTRNLLFLRIADNGTNRICSFSYDGQNFITLHTVGRTDFLTADQVFFFADSGGAAFEAGTMLYSWAQT